MKSRSPLLKILKAEAGYICRPGTEYTCSDCVFLKTVKDGHGCVFFGAKVSISAAAGGCNYFALGKPADLPWIGTLTKEELGYTENKRGFSCKRCGHFAFPKEDCDRVDKDSPGDSPGEIEENGCCGSWGPDPKRSKMTTPALLDLMAKQNQSFEEYEKSRKAR